MFSAWKKYKDKKLVKNLKRSLLSKCESKIFVVDEAYNLDESSVDEFVGILQTFQLSKSYRDEDKKKENPYGIVLKVRLLKFLWRAVNFFSSKYQKQKQGMKENERRGDLGQSSYNI